MKDFSYDRLREIDVELMLLEGDLKYCDQLEGDIYMMNFAKIVELHRRYRDLVFEKATLMGYGPHL